MRTRWGWVVLNGCWVVAWSVPDWAGEARQEVAEFLSDANRPVIVAGTTGLFLLGKEKGQKMAVHILVSEVVSQSVTESLKRLTKERRPDGSDRRSFPSGHASSAFAFAEVLAEHDPRHRRWYYGGAALIGWSRVELRKHYWWDVVAGAALGIYSARLTGGYLFKETGFSLGGRDGEAAFGVELQARGLTLLRITW